MSKNRYFTIMIVPEKTSEVRRIVVPAWLLRGAAVGGALLALLAVVMIADYGFVMSQIGENKQLKLENRKLRQEAQVFKEKITSIEQTVERMRTFATRLKVITHTEDRAGLLEKLNSTDYKIPDANSNLGEEDGRDLTSEKPISAGSPAPSLVPVSSTQPATQPIAQNVPSISSNANAANVNRSAIDPSTNTTQDEENELQAHFVSLDVRLSSINRDAIYVEQMLQDQNELLADKKAFLAALPIRKPVVGHFSSGFGVRKNPISDRVKMHEGLDIANAPGTPIQSPADGIVIFSDAKPGYGRTLIIDHGYGIETWYGHTSKLLVGRGQKVRRGENIALLGNSGMSTGPHLHYEVRVHGIPVDPLTYILEN